MTQQGIYIGKILSLKKWLVEIYCFAGKEKVLHGQLQTA